MQFKSLVPLSLTVFPRVGSRNRCSRLKTLCKTSLTLTSDITEIYRQARASCSCASFEPVPGIVHEPAPGSTRGHNADPDGETHAFPIPLRLLYLWTYVPLSSFPVLKARRHETEAEGSPSYGTGSTLCSYMLYPVREW